MNSQKNDRQDRVFDSGPRAHRGFTLVFPVVQKEVQLLDMRGLIVHRWKMPFEIATGGELLPNGNLLCGVKTEDSALPEVDGASGKLLELDWDGKIVWEYQDAYMHDDFCRMSNGNTVITRWVPTPDEIARRVKGGLPDTERDGVMWSDSLREIKPDGKVVWEWMGYEHLHPNLDIMCPLCSRSEWTHGTAFVMDAKGHIFICFLKTNCIARIDRKTGNIDWRWGGSGTLGHPHDLALLNNRHILVLGCGGHIPGFEIGESEILELDTETNNIIWEFKEYSTVDFYSPHHARLEALPNGNILVCEGDKGRILEVGLDQKIVWELVRKNEDKSGKIGNTNALFCARRYDMDYGGLKGNTPGSGTTRLKRAPLEKADKTSTKEQILAERLSKLGY